MSHAVEVLEGDPRLVNLPDHEIDDALFAYEPDCRFIIGASYQPRRLLAVARPFPHPHHRPWVTHLTREHAVTYVTQASYLLVAAAIARGDFEHLSLPEFYEACRSEEALISKLNLAFRKRREPGPTVQIVAKLDDVRVRPGNTFLACTYTIDDFVEVSAWLRAPR